VSPNGEADYVGRVEYEARHNDLVSSIARLADSVDILAKTQADNQVVNAAAAAEMRGWLKGIGVALSVVTSVAIAVAGLLHP